MTNTYTHILDAINTQANGTQPTLKAIATVLEIPATRLYALGKKPVAGQVYDPDMVNFDAISDYIATKLDEGKTAFTSMEEVIVAAVEKDAWFKENSVRSVAGANLIDVDGAKMPKRKADMFEMGSDAESLICFKHDGNVYKMVAQSLGYTAIRAVNEDGSFAREEIRVVSNSTLNTKCVAPVNMADAIAERFSGEYAEKVAETAFNAVTATVTVTAE